MFSKDMQKNAQVSMEYLFVIAFFLLLVTPIFFFSYTQLNWHNRYNRINDAVATISKTADDVCALGDGSIQYAVIQLPQGIEWTNVANKTITIHTRRFGDVYTETKCEIEGNLTTQSGIYHIALMKKNGKVYISSVSITVADYTIITFVSPTPADGSTITKDYVFINTTITDNDGISTAILEWNGVNETMSGSGTNFYINKTGLSNSVYTYKVYANDSLGNWNVSETRTVTVNKSTITCDLFYGTATENSGATNPDNALVSDDNYAILPSDTDYVRTLTFNLSNGKNRGGITSVEVAMEYHREGTYTNDNIDLSYYINTTQGATLQGYGDASSDTTVYLNVTNDTSWTWDDINALKVEGIFARQGWFEDSIDWYVDTLFSKVCYWTW